MIRPLHWARVHLFTILDVLRFVGLLILLVMFINFNAKLAKQIAATENVGRSNKEILINLRKTTRNLKRDIHRDHDAQIKYNRCIVELFGSRPNQVITRQDFNTCLKGTRLHDRELNSTPSNTTQPQNSQSNTDQTKSSTAKEQDNTEEKPTPEDPRYCSMPVVKSVINFITNDC